MSSLSVVQLVLVSESGMPQKDSIILSSIQINLYKDFYRLQGNKVSMVPCAGSKNVLLYISYVYENLARAKGLFEMGSSSVM